jgi:hypothetical protein
METQSNAAALAGLEVEAPNAEIEKLKAQLAAAEKANAALRDQKQLADTHINTADASRSASKERYAIMLDEARDQNEVDPVPVGVNGRLYQLRRGVVLDVPKEVIGVLKTAVEDRAIVKKDSAGNPTGFDLRKARRFPFQDFGLVVDAKGERVPNPRVPVVSVEA